MAKLGNFGANFGGSPVHIFDLSPSMRQDFNKRFLLAMLLSHFLFVAEQVSLDLYIITLTN